MMRGSCTRPGTSTAVPIASRTRGGNPTMTVSGPARPKLTGKRARADLAASEKRVAAILKHLCVATASPA
eukprot:11180629-Lingulodinium_polyedra.AAC.1